MNAALKGQSAGRFIGINLRQDRVSLADEELAKAINADLHTQPGAIVLRLGRTAQNANAFTDLAIRRIAKINGHRYRVAGQSVYCDDTIIINGLLSSTLITTMLPFRPQGDTTIWNFIADNSVMRKTNCTMVETWGIPAPSQPSVVVGIQGSLVGSYVAQYTFVRLVDGAVSAEGNPSDVTDAVMLASNVLALGDMDNPSDTTTNALGIYRSVGGSTVPLLDARVMIPDDNTYGVTHTVETSAVSGITLHWSVNLGTVTIGGSSVTARGTGSWEPTGTESGEDAAGRRVTYLWEISDGYVTTQTLHWAYGSSVADTGLSDIIEVDNGLPPNAAYITNYQEHIFFCRDADNPHYLWFSKRFRPEQVPAENFLELGNADDPLQCAVPLAGLLGVFARKTKYRVFGNATTGFSGLEAVSVRGTPCPMAAIPSELGILFVARDGIFSTVLSSPDTNFAEKILPLFFSETINDMLPINWNVANTFSAATYKGRYYFSYADTSSSTPNQLAVYSRDTEHWYHYDHPLRSLYVEEDTDLCLGGGLDGYVYILENGTTDNGANIALDVETKDYVGESQDVRKLFQYLKLNLNTLGATLTVRFYLDETLTHTVSVSTSSRAERLLRLPEGSLGHSWRVRFTYTGSTRVRIYACAALYLPLGAA